MVSVIGNVFKDDLTDEVTRANYIIVMADSATDAGSLENETVRSLVFKVAIRNSVFQDAGLGNWKTKAVAFGADSTAVNLQKKGGSLKERSGAHSVLSLPPT
ncbi:hypothetical protein ACROYT_G021835 [Oculina patagonica]